MPEKRGAASRMDAHHHSSDTYDANGVIQSRPRASSGVSLRPQLLTSRIRSRSLLKAAAAASDGTASSNSSNTASTTDENASRMADCPPPIDAVASPSPKFGATLLPRLAAVFAGSGSGGDNNSNSNSYTSKSDNSSNRQYTSYSHSSQLPAFPSHPISPDRVSLLSDSASSLLTFNGDADSTTTPSSSTMPSTPSSSMNGIVDNPFMGTISTVKGKSSSNSNGSPIASLPFLPRRRTLSNLFSQFTGGSSKDKELNNNSNSKKETNKESSSPPLAGAHPSGTSASKMMHVPTQGWSTSAALPTPPPSASASTSYSNPFASAFSSHYHASSSHSGSVSGSQAVVRPGSPRLKKKDSYLALNIPPTPGASTPSLAYTENGNRPLRGEDEDYMLPSPIVEADEQEHPTHVEHRHKYSQHPASSSDSYNNSNLNSIAAQPISSTSSFLSSLTSTAPTLSTHRASHQTLSTLLPPILFLCISFVISLTIMFYMVSTIPLQIPHNISEIKMQTVALRDYSRKGLSEGLHVSAVLSALFVFKQAFSVPGSILVNILFGSLYGTYAATVCACIFTGVGSVLAYYMARLCAPLVERFFPRALATTRSALLSGSSSDLFSYLLLARLFPLLPYSALNIACGVLKVPVSPYFTTLVLGSFPYNFVTTQLGDLLGNLANSAEAGNINAIWTWDLIFKLAVASVLSAAPVIFKEQLKGFIGGNSKPDGIVMPTRSTEEEESIPLAPVPTEHINPEPYAYDSYASYNQDNNAPLLRRDRTDSSASEVLFAPALELSHGPGLDGKKHKKQWSFSWNGLRRSLNNESASSEYSMTSAGSSSFASHSTARTSLDEEAGDTDEEISRERNAYNELQRRSSGSSFQSFASRQSMTAPHQHQHHSRPASMDFSKHGRRTASIESASSSPTVAQHHQFAVPSHGSGRVSQEWDRF